jgi:hypothetical protein
MVTISPQLEQFFCSIAAKYHFTPNSLSSLVVFGTGPSGIRNSWGELHFGQRTVIVAKSFLRSAIFLHLLPFFWLNIPFKHIYSYLSIAEEKFQKGSFNKELFLNKTSFNNPYLVPEICI